MKAKQIADQYGLDLRSFEHWLKHSGYRYREGRGGLAIDDGQNIDEMLSKFHEVDAEWQRAAQQKQQILAGILITSGFSFDGYTITKYSGYISGDDAVQVDRGTSGFFSQATDVGASLMSSLAHIRRNALAELKEAALALGCNAVIGVDFDYITLDPETASSSGGTMYLPYVFGVTANGNAVIIEKD